MTKPGFVPSEWLALKVVLRDVFDCNSMKGMENLQIKRDERRRCDVIRRLAACQAYEILVQYDGKIDIWSHSFSFEGRNYFLCTHTQVVQFCKLNGKKHRAIIRLKPPCIVVEVFSAGPDLIEGTLVVPCPGFKE